MAVLQRVEVGLPVHEICRELGISSVTFYKWRAKFGGMGNPPARPKAPEVEFSTKEFLREEVKIYGQPDHGCAQTG